MNETMIRKVTKEDAEAICRIYNHYVRKTIITFEEETVQVDDMQFRIQETLESGLPWIVAAIDGKIVGYAYASKWKSRCAYKHSVESTVYLSPDQTRKGLGSMLLHQLLLDIRNINMHAIIAGIALPNPGSVALHEKFGFTKVAHFKQVGYKFEQWIDVGYWELLIDDRE